jgi:serine/threonine protein kinase
MSSSFHDLAADDAATRAVRVCPRCGTANPVGRLIQAEYRCPACDFDLAYLDVSTTGSVRGVLGWVRREGEVILGRYQVTSVLGKGGFGATYLVRDLQLNGKRRALKEIPKRMFDEAEAALLARLDHASIPDIIDRGESDGMVYLALEFGGTRTLGSERKRLGGRVPLETLVPWMRQLCRVLSFLHAQNPPIIHRDLKPDNILLDDQDHIMLIDFGIAKQAGRSEETRTLGRAVSFGFSSPEQMLGSGTDQRSDIYSLAATVYFLLTGAHAPPINARLSGAPLEPLSKAVPEIPPALDEAIRKALHLNPEQRPQSVAELGQAFESCERMTPRHRSPQTGPSVESQKNNLLAPAVILLFMALIAAAIFFVGRSFVGGERAVEQAAQPQISREAMPSAPPGEAATPAGAPAPPTVIAPPVNTAPAPPQNEPAALSPPESIAPPPAEPAPVSPVPRKPAARVEVRKPAPRPALAPKPQQRKPPRPATAKPIPEEPASEPDWSGTMTRGEARKTTP